VLTTTTAAGTAFVTVDLNVQSTRSAGAGLWIGYVDCDFASGAGIVSSSGRIPIIWDGTSPRMPGANLSVLASVTQGTTATLACDATVTSGTGDPTVTVTVTGALGVSVNEFNAGYSNFAIL
jgi:hypothetical protein